MATQDSTHATRFTIPQHVILAALEPGASIDDLARESGVSCEALRTAASAYVQGLREHAAKQDRALRRKVLGVRWLSAAASVFCLGGAAVAFGATAPCTDGLVCFSTGSPAKAFEVNQNFTQLKTWIEQKVGPVTSSTVTLAAPLNGAQLADNIITSAKIVDNQIGSADLQNGGIGTDDIADNVVTSAKITNGTISNADLDSDLRCPDGSRGAYGICIFGRGDYSMNIYRAADACKAERAHLCTRAELSAASFARYENCFWGWVADRYDGANGYQSMPLNGTYSGCGNAGINERVSNFNNGGAGAYCCK